MNNCFFLRDNFNKKLEKIIKINEEKIEKIKLLKKELKNKQFKKMKNYEKEF